MATNKSDSASQLVERLVQDAQCRESPEAAPTPHDKGQLLKAAGYGDISLDAIQAALKEQLVALSAGVQVNPARVKRTEELFLKAATDQQLQQALQTAATPEAKREALAKAGYGDITLDDLKAAAANLAQREELSDAELEHVSGGAFDLGTALSGLGSLTGSAQKGGGLGSLVDPTYGPLIGAAVGLGTSLLGAATTAITTAPKASDW